MANNDEIKVSSRVWSEVHKKEGTVCFPMANVTAAIELDDGSKLLCRKKELKVIPKEPAIMNDKEWEQLHAKDMKKLAAELPDPEEKKPTVKLTEAALKKIESMLAKNEPQALLCKAEATATKVSKAEGGLVDPEAFAKKVYTDISSNKNVEFDNVERPKHYASDRVECIDAMEMVFGKQAVINFCMCNAFKYNWRADLKNGDEDLAKARWYMKKVKELVNKE